jgi:hypothetical protein
MCGTTLFSRSDSPFCSIAVTSRSEYSIYPHADRTPGVSPGAAAHLACPRAQQHPKTVRKTCSMEGTDRTRDSHRSVRLDSAAEWRRRGHVRRGRRALAPKTRHTGLLAEHVAIAASGASGPCHIAHRVPVPAPTAVARRPCRARVVVALRHVRVCRAE